MKINISGLMNLIKTEEKKAGMLANEINVNIYTISIEELNGNVNMINDTKEEFTKHLNDYKEALQRITKLKSVLYEKNNLYKLSDGRSIQTAIVDNNNLRKLLETYEMLLISKSSKRRVTEVNNSYFECSTINFNKDEIEKEVNELNEVIQKTDFEISKLNSEEFEINL